MRYASIDIGTNTLRLLIAEDAGGGRLNPILYKRAITRLGGGYREDAGISREAAERTLMALYEFRRSIVEHGIDPAHVLAFATSVVRRACNRDSFAFEVLKRTGISINIISGDEEARLSLAGVLSVIDDGSGKKVVMDVGGGSTEFIFTDGHGISGAFSMEMGVVHLTEDHLKSDPPAKDELKAIEDEIDGVISALMRRARDCGVDLDAYSGEAGAVFVGTAGTVTTLAAIDLDLKSYDREKVNNHTIGKDRIRGIYDGLASLRLEERRNVLSLEKGREDLILPGTAIALKAMDAFGFERLKVSDAGLLEGIILARLKGAPGAA